MSLALLERSLVDEGWRITERKPVELHGKPAWDIWVDGRFYFTVSELAFSRAGKNIAAHMVKQIKEMKRR